MDKINTYKKEGIFYGKYYSLLESIAKFIDSYSIDVSIVTKSTLNLINRYCRIKSLNEACSSEPEINGNEMNGEINESNESNDETDDEIN